MTISKLNLTVPTIYSDLVFVIFNFPVNFDSGTLRLILFPKKIEVYSSLQMLLVRNWGPLSLRSPDHGTVSHLVCYGSEYTPCKLSFNCLTRLSCLHIDLNITQSILSNKLFHDMNKPTWIVIQHRVNFFLNGQQNFIRFFRC